ncbi:MAG: hypothetical protein Q9218_006473 [Villophora microphyllina]
MASDLPTTLDQLIQTFAVQQEDPRIGWGCGVCLEPYGVSHQDDTPIELPVCKHMLGKTCISTWLTSGNNTCPFCRQRVLAAIVVPQTEFDAEAFWQEELSQWRAGWIDERVPSEEMRYFETLFANLCEDIVRYIEDPSVVDSEEWLCFRVPYRYIVALGTFERFAEVIRGEPGYIQGLASDLPASLPNPEAYHRFITAINGLPRVRRRPDGVIDFSVETLGRLLFFYIRIERAQEALRERLIEASRVPYTGTF